MNDAAIKSFTDVLGASPLTCATVMVVILFVLLGIAIIRVIKNGLTEVQEDNDNFDYSDYMFVIIRILAVFLVVAIFFGI